MRDISELEYEWPKFKPIPKLSKTDIRMLKQCLPDAPEIVIRGSDEEILDALIERGLIDETVEYRNGKRTTYVITNKVGMALLKMNEKKQMFAPRSESAVSSSK